MTAKERIESIVQEVIASRCVGKTVDYESVALAHPDLMPMLGDRLKRLQAVDVAAARPLHSSDDRRAESGDAEVNPDIAFLSDALQGFDIVEHVDFGGQGRVYKAVQTAMKRTVAIKVLLDGPFASKQQRDRFDREIELVSRLKDRRIVTVYDTGVVEGRPYLVSEYVDGIPLDDYVLLEDLDLADRLKLFLEICDAVAVAHRHGVIHRDLKPSNILVDSEGCPHVLDFGLAKDVTSESAGRSLSVQGHVIGTLAYLSPEQASGFSDKVDVRSDVYTLGVLLFEMITGALPYRTDDSRDKVLDRIVTHLPRRMRAVLEASGDQGAIKGKGLDEDVDTIVSQCLRKEPDDRYQSVHALAKDIRRFLAGDPIEARADSKVYLLRKVLWKFRIHVAIAACFIVILVGSLIGMTVLWKRAERIAMIAQTGLNHGSFVRRASAAQKKGDRLAALDLLKQAVDLESFVPEDDPLVKRQIFSAHHNLAEIYFDQGDLQNARLHCDRAMALSEEFQDQDPDDLEWYRLSSFSHKLYGSLAYKEKDWNAALHHFSTMLEIRTRVAEMEPNDPSNFASLAPAYELIGRTYRKLGKTDLSVQSHLLAKMVAEKLLDGEPSSIEFALKVGRAEVSLAKAYKDYKTVRGDQFARLWLETARQRFRAALRSPRLSDQTPLISRFLDSIDELHQQLDAHIRFLRIGVHLYAGYGSSGSIGTSTSSSSPSASGSEGLSAATNAYVNLPVIGKSDP